MTSISDNYPTQARAWRICKALATALQSDSKLAQYLVLDDTDEPLIFWHQSQSAKLRMQGQKAMAFITMLPPAVSPKDNSPQGYASALNLNIPILIAVSELHGTNALDYCARLSDAVITASLAEIDAGGYPNMTLASIDATNISPIEGMSNWTATTVTLSTTYHHQ